MTLAGAIVFAPLSWACFHYPSSCLPCCLIFSSDK
ncbi:hypothetical protein PRUB_a6004 [Pseudoalteromonas rubra]|uniref:Uncharacterized protein n=1 Tax=Pseudoalteromonas rubra TaxID=43658 RepID=A0A8T0C648_9GAMM|nr:hypothetical protein PRUB_a6004 [Pseudoalteromonas rubra]